VTTPVATSPPTAGRPPARRRRRLLRLLVGVLVLGLVAVLGLAGLAAWFCSQADLSNVGQLGFANQLKIPHLPSRAWTTPAVRCSTHQRDGNGPSEQSKLNA
jgi:hypothetical protein